MTRRLGSVVLWSQAVVLVFAAVVARAVNLVTDPERAALAFVAGIGITLLAVVAAVAMRSRVGVALGWIAQAATLAYALAVPTMLLVGVIFTGLWAVAMYQGRKMDALTDAYVAAHPEV